jgi:hypothetical protein
VAADLAAQGYRAVSVLCDEEGDPRGIEATSSAGAADRTA